MSEPKLCPYRKRYKTPEEYWDHADDSLAPCLQDKCAMWRTIARRDEGTAPDGMGNIVSYSLIVEGVGYCGLAGKP